MVAITDIHWAAGFLDGEGYFGRSQRRIAITCTQKDKWMVEKLKALFGGTVYSAPDPKTKAQYWRWQCSGKIAAGLMMSVYVLMSPRRQERIRQVLTFWKSLPTRGRWRDGIAHCKRGHEFTPENTYLKNGKHRQCRTCQRAAAKQWNANRVLTTCLD